MVNLLLPRSKLETSCGLDIAAKFRAIVSSPALSPWSETLKLATIPMKAVKYIRYFICDSILARFLFVP